MDEMKIYLGRAVGNMSKIEGIQEDDILSLVSLEAVSVAPLTVSVTDFVALLDTGIRDEIWLVRCNVVCLLKCVHC